MGMFLKVYNDKNNKNESIGFKLWKFINQI